MEQNEKKTRCYRFTGSFAAKLAAFLLLIVSTAAAAAGALVCYADESFGMYESGGSLQSAVMQALEGQSYQYAKAVTGCLEAGEPEAARQLMQGTNAQVQLLDGEAYFEENAEVLWQTGEPAENAVCVTVRVPGSFAIDGLKTDAGKTYNKISLFRICYEPDFQVQDEARDIYSIVKILYALRYHVFWMLALCMLCFIASFLFLLSGAGRKSGCEEIVPGVAAPLHLDLLTIGVAALLSVIFIVASMLIERLGTVSAAVCLAASALGAEVIVMLYLMELAIRLKQGHWWKNTLLWGILRLLYRAARFVVRGLGRLIRTIPVVPFTVLTFVGICVLEFFGMMIYVRRSGALGLWLLEKLILFPLVLYFSLMCRRLAQAGEALADGREGYTVDTSGMFGEWKEHGENLNSISQGITRAVAERMKSEHLKTELITNVSHDLKTPLTSIINYTDLICAEKTENPKIEEYAEVLFRQSKRLKKLLEDLLEASKATTGNVEVHLEPCEAGVLLSQLVGEYEQRLAERGLELRTSQPEQPEQIMADGRLLCRIFDNLLNNICKYAQEGSRVYLSVEKQEQRVRIVFRNMSKYALDIPAEELQERFVRGDKSRHMEGSGLGLSIANSLTQLQGGTMEIVIDGDLFKVILEFPKA